MNQVQYPYNINLLPSMIRILILLLIYIQYSEHEKAF